MSYEPQIDLHKEDAHAYYGDFQSGASAFTGSVDRTVSAVVVSSTEVVLMEGTASSSAVGTDLRVYSSGTESEVNLGTYSVNRLNASKSGYILSQSTKIPSPDIETLLSAEDLVTDQLSKEVWFVSDIDLTDPAGDGSIRSVADGDILCIESGSDVGFHKIAKVGIAGGLTNDRTMELYSSLTDNDSTVTCRIISTIKCVVSTEETAYSDIVYIPADDADLSKFLSTESTGTGTIINPYEILVPKRHLSDTLRSTTLTLTGGSNSGVATISGVNESRTGYKVGYPLTGPFPASVEYKVSIDSSIDSRLFILDGQAYDILSAELDENQLPISEGGRGPVWVVVIKEKAAPYGVDGLSWSVGHTLTVPSVDFEGSGVMPNDLIMFEVVNTKSPYLSGLIPCTVTGAKGSRVSFGVGTGVIDLGAEGLTDSEWAKFNSTFKLELLYVNPAGTLVRDGAAEEVSQYLQSIGFASAFHNIPILPSFDNDLPAITVSVRPKFLVRNTRITVDKSLDSVPMLQEYIVSPAVGANADGEIVVVSSDQEVTVVPAEPFELVENRDFVIESESSISGTRLSTESGSSEVSIVSADLLDRDIRSGDTLDIESGFDTGRYVVVSVLSGSTLVVRNQEDGSVPSTTESGLSFTINRKTPGRFLRFIDKTFVPSDPAPPRLWAETSYYDNAGYIENNFGTLVNLTKDSLSEYGSSTISYTNAVRALMYSYSSGPSVRNISIGCHILVDQPVSETQGVIVRVDPGYSSTQGRILIEDVSPITHKLTGLVRPYFYPIETSEGFKDFAGIAINPRTGVAYAGGDFVRAFSPLSNTVMVSDYLTDPDWWNFKKEYGKSELRKYHSFEVVLDAASVDSRDIPLVDDFINNIRPVYTRPELILLVYLVDDVVTEDDLYIDLTLFNFDDIAFSLETTHMVDDYNGSSLLTRVEDVGSFATRTLFEGDDLSTTGEVRIVGPGLTTSGFGTLTVPTSGLGEYSVHKVTSERGGFTGPITYINKYFTEDVVGEDFTVLGDNLVRPGDVLFIRRGPNRARFEVFEVEDDNTLWVTLANLPPRMMNARKIEEESNQIFQVQRLDFNPIAKSEGLSVVAGNSEVSDLTRDFGWEGVAQDDQLLIERGDNYGVYTVTQVGVNGVDDDGLPFRDFSKLLVHPDPGTTESGVSYRIERDQLRENVLLDGHAQSVFMDTLKVIGGGVTLARLRYGDELTVHTGRDDGTVFKVIDTPDDFTIIVDGYFSSVPGLITSGYGLPLGIVGGPPLIPMSGLTGVWEKDKQRFTVSRRFSDHPIDSDSLYERLDPYDFYEVDVYHPMSELFSVPDIHVLGSSATSLSADPAILAATSSMLLELRSTDTNPYAFTPGVGTYEIESFDGVDTVSLSSEASVDTSSGTVGPFSGRFIGETYDFVVKGEYVYSTSGYNFRFPYQGTIEGRYGGIYFSNTGTVLDPLAASNILMKILYLVRTGDGSGGAGYFPTGMSVMLEGDSDTWAEVESIKPKGPGLITGGLGSMGMVCGGLGPGPVTKITLKSGYTGTTGTQGNLMFRWALGEVLRGDLFTCSEGEFVVRYVTDDDHKAVGSGSPSYLRLTRNTGVSVETAYTGRVFRRRLPV